MSRSHSKHHSLKTKAKLSSAAPNILPPEIKQSSFLRNKVHVHDITAMGFSTSKQPHVRRSPGGPKGQIYTQMWISENYQVLGCVCLNKVVYSGNEEPKKSDWKPRTVWGGTKFPGFSLIPQFPLSQGRSLSSIVKDTDCISWHFPISPGASGG